MLMTASCQGTTSANGKIVKSPTKTGITPCFTASNNISVNAAVGLEEEKKEGSRSMNCRPDSTSVGASLSARLTQSTEHPLVTSLLLHLNNPTVLESLSGISSLHFPSSDGTCCCLIGFTSASKAVFVVTGTARGCPSFDLCVINCPRWQNTENSTTL